MMTGVFSIMMKRAALLFAACTCLGMPLFGELPAASEIMQRVAANQDRAQELRTAYVYQQKIHIRMTDSHGKLRTEETAEYVVTPTATGTKKELIHLNGKYLHKRRYIEYSDAAVQKEQCSIECVQEMRDELVNDEGSRDSLNRHLFPLTSKELEKYDFALKGEEVFRGVSVYRIAFVPKKQPGFNIDFDTAEGPWAGEALISRDDFQPIEINTHPARPVPAAARVFLGLNLHGWGYSVRYEKFDGGVWFPVSYGTEAYVRVLFFYVRNVTLALENSGFRRTDVKSTVHFPAEK